MIPSIFFSPEDIAALKAEPFCFLTGLPERWASKLKPSFHLCGCWEWQGAKNGKTGYGKVTYRGRQILAHRAIYEFMVGEIPGGLVIHHLCYNRKCVNPFHLALASYAENTHDSPNVILFRKTAA